MNATFPIIDADSFLNGKKTTIRIPRRNAPAPDEQEMNNSVKLIDEIMTQAVQASFKTETADMQDDGVLSHLGDYSEAPFTLIESYFNPQYLRRLVRHQIESYDNFITTQIHRTVQMFNPVSIHSENDVDEATGLKYIEVVLSFENLKFNPPQIHENNGATKLMLPQEAKLRNFTYASTVSVDVHIKYVIRSPGAMHQPRIIEKVLPKINICKMPIMVKSPICVLTQNKHIDPVYTGECTMDCGGYFVIKGSEKTVLGQERAAENRIYCFDGKNTTRWSWYAEIKSVPDYKCISPKQVDMMVASKNNGFGHAMYVNIPRVKNPIDLFVLFRALGVLSDKEICETILLDVDTSQNAELLKCLHASIIEANKCMTQEDAIKIITTAVAYTPAPFDKRKVETAESLAADKEKGASKKREFAIEVLNNDLFPHCRTMPQKIYLVGVMAKKLIQVSLGWLPPDDRDSYINKRIELTGTLLNNLFRNYFNKLVKEVKKQVVREINTGAWRSSWRMETTEVETSTEDTSTNTLRTDEDYGNIINMTNIYKIIKSTTIENGINRALSTGDFSVKQANSSKVGVAQVLNRLTYTASLSHLRRINTPLEKSGELIAPRKLHNSTWGFLCPAETPEGQSIGIVKNISYMSHITIPSISASSCLAEFIEPFIVKVEDVKSPKELYGKIKVVVNGAWLGVANEPNVLYADLKAKKCGGIINIYTSVIFDYKMMEIRICTDGGRLTRPVLRVKNNRAILTQDVVDRVERRELTWNDLLTNARLPESVIEYIDPEEQNYAMIAMKAKRTYLHGVETSMRYTHCELHPSTIFGVLASCIPFPEHNQAPRNTYQTAMGKQAIGVYATNFDQRMDKTAYVLSYPSRPLVDTRLMNFIHLNQIPSGCQIQVAIMTHTGYNQEDSVLINKGSIDRGLFSATIYHTEKDEDKNIIRDEIIRCKPDPRKTKGNKYGNYNKLNSQGFIPENTLVENRDVIIAKVVPIKETRNDPTKTVKYEDQSKTFRTTEETYIDKNYTGRNGDGYNFAKVRVRTFRKPVLGDKFCALPTQQVLTDKGWVEIKDVDPATHRVCSLDVNGNMCYEYPSAKFEYDHDSIDGDDDQLYTVKNKQVEITCTMNHKLYVQTRGSYNRGGAYELIEAKNVMGKMVRFQKTMENVYSDIETIDVGGVAYPMDAWLKLVGMFISDGHCDKNGVGMYISAIKERKVDYVSDILNELGVTWTYQEAGKFFVSAPKNRNVYDEMSKFSLGALNKHLPEYVWTLSKTQSIVLMEALLQGDGHTMKYKGEDEFSRYGTISPQLADDIMRLALHCGWSGIVKIAEEPTGLVRKGVRNMGTRAGEEMEATLKHTYYKVSIIREQNQPWINKKKNDSNTEGTVDYKGKVYCIEMPSSHVYYMRESTHSPALIIGNSSRHGQKGTCGNIIPECDMPYTAGGMKPDIIINPHAIPSRMTIAQLKETLLGKVLVQLGMFGDGTSFGTLDIATIAKELQKLGYESYGNEVMYNGLTGEQLEMSVFIGPVFYQRLKHMVNDKQHSRSIGPMVNLTRQPAEGRSRDGGFRVGEMERDVLIAHGMANFCKERLLDVSDKYSAWVCKCCGMLAAHNESERFTIHKCHTCENKTEFARVEIPYSYKLLSQELQTINVMPRLIVADN
jgi:DNA-directed RNA polymerase II subunit RPB2